MTFWGSVLYYSPLLISQQMLAALGTRTFYHYQDRVPREGAVLVVSNHRSFMDAPLLMAAIARPIRFACHHYMGQVPVLKDFVTRLGCFPLDLPEQRQQSFFHQAGELLQTGQCVGLFPEGAQPMVQFTPPGTMGDFQRGFAHLALRSPVTDLAVLPVAIAPQSETTNSFFPLQILSWFDPTEPLFQQSGMHPMVIYKRVDLLVGRPVWISAAQRQAYQGKHAKQQVLELTRYCEGEIQGLMKSCME
ncbi:MAG: 1-acyl-sn-glycerol-3-phosphate acyltransferase [Oculatellaceae cyanobacterium Prado106]|nr:1-acyl-sn-glycerol-3-phosphate acyltransferase [Oculatellaceae cyanobacterium Prado106]